jgi:hypothetical protein
MHGFRCMHATQVLRLPRLHECPFRVISTIGGLLGPLPTCCLLARVAARWHCEVVGPRGVDGWHTFCFISFLHYKNGCCNVAFLGSWLKMWWCWGLLSQGLHHLRWQGCRHHAWLHRWPTWSGKWRAAGGCCCCGWKSGNSACVGDLGGPQTAQHTSL